MDDATLAAVRARLDAIEAGIRPGDAPRYIGNPHFGAQLCPEHDRALRAAPALLAVARAAAGLAAEEEPWVGPEDSGAHRWCSACSHCAGCIGHDADCPGEALLAALARLAADGAGEVDG